MDLNKNIFRQICECLHNYDPHIVEIVQFGSSVYAPKYAIDLDLLLFTKQEKDYGGYLDSLDELNLPFDVDLVVKSINKPLGESFAQQIMGSYEIVYGTGEWLKRTASGLNDPQFEEVWEVLETAREHIADAEKKDREAVKDRYIRNAFNELFHAARIASMNYLSTEEPRWGQIKKMLPNPYRKEFQESITKLHVQYFYHGNYPKDRVKEEFENWHRKVESYVKRLEEKTENERRAHES